MRTPKPAIERFEYQDQGGPHKWVTVLRPYQSQRRHCETTQEQAQVDRGCGWNARTLAEPFQPAKTAHQFSSLENGGHYGGKGNGAKEIILELSQSVAAEVFPIGGPGIDHLKNPPNRGRGDEKQNKVAS